MKFPSLFHRGSGKRGQSPAEVRKERDTLADKCTDLTAENADLRERLEATEADRDWFHAHWMEVGYRAIDAETVAACLEGRLAEAQKAVAELEAIAGPHVSSDNAPTPLFMEVTQNTRISSGDPDSQKTAETAVKTLAAAVGAA